MKLNVPTTTFSTIAQCFAVCWIILNFACFTLCMIHPHASLYYFLVSPVSHFWLITKIKHQHSLTHYTKLDTTGANCCFRYQAPFFFISDSLFSPVLFFYILMTFRGSSIRGAIIWFLSVVGYSATQLSPHTIELSAQKHSTTAEYYSNLISSSP